MRVKKGHERTSTHNVSLFAVNDVRHVIRLEDVNQHWGIRYSIEE